MKVMMRKKVYIADNDPGLMELMTDYLDDRGYEAVGSTDLFDLLFGDEANLPDIFLLNALVWGEDIENVCNYLKSNRLTKGIPIILFSTLNREVQNSFNRYADSFIYIPFEIHDLPGLLEKFTC